MREPRHRRDGRVRDVLCLQLIFSSESFNSSVQKRDQNLSTMAFALTKIAKFVNKNAFVTPLSSVISSNNCK